LFVILFLSEGKDAKEFDKVLNEPFLLFSFEEADLGDLEE
jgi:hypothetical protein